MTSPSVIDVLVAVDGATMVQTLAPGSQDNPTVVATPLIFMIVKDADEVFGQASKELKLNATTGDIIRWRATSLSFDDNYQVMLYKYLVLRGNDLLSAPTPLTIQANAPLPDPSNPTVPKRQTRKYHFWQATVLLPGEVTYAFHFIVMDRDSKPLGFFYWDPFIAISDGSPTKALE